MDTPSHLLPSGADASGPCAASPSDAAQPHAGAPAADPRLVIRGESTEEDNSHPGERIQLIAFGKGYGKAIAIPLPRRDGRADAAFTDWLNVTFKIDSEGFDPQSFFDSFSEATQHIFGGMTDRHRGLNGWNLSFVFDRGGVMFAFGGQRGTALISIPGEGCAFIADWMMLTSLLRDRLRGRITRWDGAKDQYDGLPSVDDAVKLYLDDQFNAGGRRPIPKQIGNWITPDTLGRTFQVGLRESGKVLRIYEKGKQLGNPESVWVRWELELHSEDRNIPWEVLERPGQYLAGAYPCLSWVSEASSRIRTVKAQDSISYERLKRAASNAYGRLIDVMMEREGGAEEVVALLRRDGRPKRLSFTDDYLRCKSDEHEV